MREPILPGQKFGNVEVIKEAKKNKWGARIWTCRCRCGDLVDVQASHLRHGYQQCGSCFRKKFAKINQTHGMSKSPEYHAWLHMRRRCEDENDRLFDDYGGRGIKVSKEWDTFDQFFKDMGRRPGLKYSIDRKDNDGDYQASNCRWATGTEQARNKRNNVKITAFGMSLTPMEWHELTGISLQAIRSRIRKNWTDEQIIGVPVRKWIKSS